MVSPAAALGLAAGLVAVAILLGLAAGRNVALLIVAYAVLMLAYSEWGRSRAPIDVFIIAAGFLLRALAGAAAGPVPASPWFLALTLLLAMMLGFGKRRAEISLLGTGGQACPRQPRGVHRRHAGPAAVGAGGEHHRALRDLRRQHHHPHRLQRHDPDLAAGPFRDRSLPQVSHTTERPPDELLVRDRVLLTVVVAYAAIAATVLHYHTHLVSLVSLG